MVLDAWTFIPFMMIMILAGLQAIPKELTEAARVDGAGPWKTFWEVTFPLMLPVSVTAILIRIIFKLKLADIVINLTAGGPGGATDTVTSFIFREYRDRAIRETVAAAAPRIGEVGSDESRSPRDQNLHLASLSSLAIS